MPARAAPCGARALPCPANLAPPTYPRSVVVIHDAAPLRHPDWYSRAYASGQRLVLPAVARRARRAVTVSEFARAELQELLGVDAAVVAGGVDERSTPAADAEPARRRSPLTASRARRARHEVCGGSHGRRKIPAFALEFLIGA
jgi:hypothetical protein